MSSVENAILTPVLESKKSEVNPLDAGKAHEYDCH